MPPLEELLKTLIAIPSVNPEYGGTGEGEMMAYVADWMAERGMEVRRQDVFPGRTNLIVALGDVSKGTTLIEAHMDTVGVAGWFKGSPWEPFVEDGKLFGRGSCDTKASLAVFMSVAAHFAAHPEELKRPMAFAASVDEEDGQAGAFALAKLKEELNIHAAITGEPTGSRIVHAHKGVCRYTLEARGKAAHGSMPELGVNSIYKMARIAGRLEALAAELRAGGGGDELATGSLNLGEIHGGIGFNIVPDRCVVEVDRRLGIGETWVEARKALEAIVATEPDCRIAKAEERGTVWTDPEHWFPQALLSAAEAESIESKLDRVRYMTNAVAYFEVGIPSVVFGPGDIAQAHKIDEFIELGEMERSFRILKRYFSTAP